MIKTLIKAEDQPAELKEFDIQIGTRSDPRSVINLVPVPMQKAIESVPQELLDMDEHSLKMKIKPNPTINRLRLSFWNEYNRAQETGTAMNMTKVYAGVCSNPFFYDRVLPVPVLVAWIICPPAEYTKALEEVLYEGIEQLREIITMPVKNPVTNEFNHKAIDQIIKVYTLIEQRIKGAVVQKMETKSAHLHLKAGKNILPGLTQEKDMESIQKRIAEIEKENRKVFEARNHKLIEIEADEVPEEN